MEIDPKELKQLIKEAVREVLEEQSQASGQDESTSPKSLTYEEVFHRIMAQVARGEIDEKTAGKLIAEAREGFGDSGTQNSKAENTESSTPPLEPRPALLDRLIDWEKELQGYTGRAAESTLEMMERMREKLEKEAQEAAFYRASQELEKDEAQKKAAEDLKSIKERLAKDK